MLKRYIFLIIATSFGLFINGRCQNNENNVLEYKNSRVEYTIVIVKDHTNNSIAKQRAIKRAALLAKRNGFLSFNLIDEKEVEVVLGKKNWPSPYDFPQDLYQEEIIERGYNRERIISGSRPDYKLRKALKIKIKCFVNEEGSYKVCKIIEC